MHSQSSPTLPQSQDQSVIPLPSLDLSKDDCQIKSFRACWPLLGGYGSREARDEGRRENVEKRDGGKSSRCSNQDEGRVAKR